MPAPHVVYGIPSTVACIAYNLFDNQDKILKLNEPQAINVYTRFMLDINIGQGVELPWIQNSECPNSSEYLEIAAMKSSVFFVFCIQFMQLFSKSKEEYKYFSLLLGNCKSDLLVNFLKRDFLFMSNFLCRFVLAIPQRLQRSFHAR